MRTRKLFIIAVLIAGCGGGLLEGEPHESACGGAPPRGTGGNGGAPADAGADREQPDAEPTIQVDACSVIGCGG